MNAGCDAAIRRATTADESAVRRLIADAYAEYESVIPTELYAPYLADLLDVETRAIDGDLLVAEVDGVIVGTVTFYPDAVAERLGWPAGWTGIRALAVDPRHRGNGVGRKLIDVCIDRSVRAGAAVVCLHTAVFIRAAVHIYEGLGFVRAPEFDVTAADMMDVGDVEGPLVIAYRLELRT